jgi:hypothetical protein
MLTTIIGFKTGTVLESKSIESIIWYMGRRTVKRKCSIKNKKPKFSTKKNSWLNPKVVIRMISGREFTQEFTSNDKAEIYHDNLVTALKRFVI